MIVARRMIIKAYHHLVNLVLSGVGLGCPGNVKVSSGEGTKIYQAKLGETVEINFQE